MKLFFAIFLAVMSADAAACGVCIDDKVASCYDYAVVAQAKARGHEVAFFAIDGPVIVNAENRKRILKAVQAHRGVLPGTARVSLENAALSFAYDPARTSATHAGRALTRTMQRRGLRLTLLRIMN